MVLLKNVALGYNKTEKYLHVPSETLAFKTGTDCHAQDMNCLWHCFEIPPCRENCLTRQESLCTAVKGVLETN